MITIPGQLAIRTISGRNGDFNVGRLATSIGEFVIKDALLDQYHEGKYRGDFVIAEIRPSYYSTGGRLVVEIRAKLDSMTLDDLDHLTAEETATFSSTELDPLEEERSQTPPPEPARKAKAPTPARSTPKPPAGPTAEAPLGMSDAKPAPTTDAASGDADLFGTVWPLGETVKLDTTVDRQRLRAQCARLGALGYSLDFRQQVWHRPTT